MSYVEKTKRPKFQPKVERTLYLGTSIDHTEDTYKLYRPAKQDIIFRRNAYFNERSFPGRKLNPLPTIKDTGEDLIGSEFEDEGITWIVTQTGQHEGAPILWYKNKENDDEEYSSVPEVRTLQQDW